MDITDLHDDQFFAVTDLIATHVTPGHYMFDLRITPSFAGKHIYVFCYACHCPGTQAYADATSAERHARSGFHVRIGARGGVKHLK